MGHVKYLKKPYDDNSREAVTKNLPLNPRRLSDFPICDFCGKGRPIIMYGANRMTSGAPIPCWRWLSCDVCEPLVDEGRWDEMHQRIGAHLRVMMHLPFTVPSEILDDAVWAAIKMFLKDATRI